MMQNKMRTAVKAANENLKKVYDWLDSENVIEKMTSELNLKLYDAAYYNYDFIDNNKQYWYNKREIALFNRFCDDEYQNLCDWCFENTDQDFGNMIKHIGFSSSFYFDTDLYDYRHNKIIYCDTLLHSHQYEIGYYSVIQSILYNVIGNECVDIIGSDGYVSSRTINDDFEWYIDKGYRLAYIYDYLEWLSDPDLLNDIKNKYENYITVYNYIADFKAHQVEIFKKYIDDEYEWYLETLEDDIA